ncbi:MAG: hypothetical protein ACRD3T_07890 [Terriglobia bacterium]
MRRRRRGLTAPVLLISLGILLLLDQMVPRLGFEHTWPVLLIEFGVLLLVDGLGPPRPPEGPRVETSDT